MKDRPGLHPMFDVSILKDHSSYHHEEFKEIIKADMQPKKKNI
jgi:hypothetical protein